MPVPGVDYAPVGSTKPLSDQKPVAIAHGPSRPKTSRTKKYEENLALIQQAEEEYARAAQFAYNRQNAGKSKPPLWQRAAGVALKGLQYTSASEWAYKIPGVGDDIQHQVERVPGLRTALGAATSPLTYLAPGVGGAGLIGRAAVAGGTRSALIAGLATSAGAGLGEAALSEKGLGLDLPFVPEKYEPLVGGLAGGLGGMAGSGRVMARGIGAAKFGQDAAVARTELKRIAQQRMKSGLKGNDVLWEHPDNGRLFFIRPDDVDIPNRITLDDLLGPRPDIDQYILPDQNSGAFVYTAGSRDDVMKLSTSGLGKTNLYQPNITTVRPDAEALIRVPKSATTTDQSGQIVGRGAIAADNMQVLRSDGKWTSIRNLGVEDTRIPWKEHVVSEPDAYVHDGTSWRLRNAEDEVDVLEEALPITLEAPAAAQPAPTEMLESIARGTRVFDRPDATPTPPAGMRYVDRTPEPPAVSKVEDFVEAVDDPAAARMFHGTTSEGAAGIATDKRIRPTEAATGTMPGVYLHEAPETAAVSARTSARLSGAEEAIVPTDLSPLANIARRSEVDAIKNELGLGDTPEDMVRLVEGLKERGYNGADISAQLGNVRQGRMVVFDDALVTPLEAEDAKAYLLSRGINPDEDSAALTQRLADIKEDRQAVDHISSAETREDAIVRAKERLAADGEIDNGQVGRDAGSGTASGEPGAADVGSPPDLTDGTAGGRGELLPEPDVETQRAVPEQPRADLPESAAAVEQRTRVERIDSAGLTSGRADPSEILARSRLVERPVTPKHEPRVISEAGDGAEFTAPVTTERIVPIAEDFNRFTDDLFQNDASRAAGQKIAESHPALKNLVEVVGGKSATAVKDFQKKIVGYSARSVVDRDRLTASIAHLRQGKRPFVQLENDLTKITSWRGNEVTVPLGDVISNPGNFQLNAAQNGWINRYHRIVDEFVEDAIAEGVDINELGYAKRGDHYVPRKVIGKDEIEKDSAYVKAGVGAKQSFQKARYHMSQAEGAREGVIYADSVEALEEFGRGIMKATRDKIITRELKAIGRTGRELAGPKVQEARDAAAAELRQARRALAQARREAGGEKLRMVETRGEQGAKKLSKVEVKALVEEDGHVISARESLTKAKNDLNFAKQKLAGLKTDKGKARWGKSIEDTQKRIDAARDELADARTNARSNATEVNTGQRGFRVENAQARLKNAQQRLSDAQERLDEVRGQATKTRRETGQIIRREGATFAQDAGKFGIPDAGDIKVRQVRNLPGLQGRLFPDDVAEYIEQGLTEQGSRALTRVSNVNDLARIARASTDFGTTLIQGLPILARRPDVWAKAAAMSFRSFIDPEYLQKFYVQNADTLKDIINHVGGLSNNEYFAAAQREGLLAAAARSDVLALKGAGKSVERFSVSFDAFLDGAKIHMWNAMKPYMKSAKDKESIGRFIRNMTGTTNTARLGVSPVQRQVESLLMFSPRFTRSVFALGAQAFEKGAAGGQARRSLAQMVAGAMILYAGAKYTIDGEMPTWKDYDPSQGGRFMSIKVGDNYVGIGGAVRSAIQLIGNSAAAAATDPSRFLSTDTTSVDESNPILKWARGRSSPVIGSVINRITGGPVVGEEYESNMDFITRLPDEFMPFGAAAWAETSGGIGQKLSIFGAQSLGLRTFPESISEDFNLRVNDVIKDMSGEGFSSGDKEDIEGWNDLTVFQKQQVLQANPELRKQLSEKEQANWDEYDEIRTQTEEAKRGLGERLLATRKKQETGEALTENDLTPKMYRDALATMEDRRRGALALLQDANIYSGLGGEEPGSFSTRTHRQQVMDAYYEMLRNANVVDPITGMMDFAAKDEAEQGFLAQLSESDRAIIQQERGASFDAIERELKVAKTALAPYWEINDQVAKSMGFESSADIALNGSPAQQRRYNKLRSRMKERMRRDNPEVDQLLIQWGYVTRPERSNRRTVVRVNI